MSPSKNKPPVYLLVILPILVIGGVCVFSGLLHVYCDIKSIPPSAVPNLNGALISLPAIFLWIPVSLLLGNLVLYCVPPLRRVAKQLVRESGLPGFLESQKAMLKLLLILASICIPLIVLGFAL
jgi:hypothetical protein